MNRVLLKASEIFLSAFLPMLDDSSRQRCWDELQACAVQYLQYGLGNDSRGTQWRDHLDREAVRVSLQQVIVFLFETSIAQLLFCPALLSCCCSRNS